MNDDFEFSDCNPPQRELQPTNPLQKFLKLEFELLNSFIEDKMSELKKEFENELEESKKNVREYVKLKKIIIKKAEFDKMYTKRHPNRNKFHKNDNNTNIEGIPLKSSSQKWNQRKQSPQFRNQRSNMVRELPNSQKSRVNDKWNTHTDFQENPNKNIQKTDPKRNPHPNNRGNRNNE